MIASREPALWVALGSIAIKLLSAFFLHLGVEQQSAMNAVVAAVCGLVVAFSTRDGLSAAILGLGQGLLALALGFGLRIDADTQATIMSAIGLGVAMFVRTQVTALVPPPPS